MSVHRFALLVLEGVAQQRIGVKGTRFDELTRPVGANKEYLGKDSERTERCCSTKVSS